MNEEQKKYWEQKLLESVLEEPTPFFRSRYPVTWRQRLHNRYLRVVDKIYELLTGRDPNEE